MNNRLSIFLLFLMSIQFLSFNCHKDIEQHQENNLTIKKGGIGSLTIGEPINSIFNYYKGYKIKEIEGEGFFIFDSEELLINVFSKNDSLISGIKIYSSKYNLLDEIRINLPINIIKNKFIDFNLQIDPLTGEEYFAPKEFQIYNNNDESCDICMFIYFESNDNLTIGEYKYYLPHEKSYKVKDNGYIKYILIYDSN